MLNKISHDDFLPVLHNLSSNFTYFVTVRFISSRVDCHCSLLWLANPVITDNLMFGSQLGTDMTFRYTSPEMAIAYIWNKIL